MKLIPWTPPELDPEVGAVLIPQPKAPALTWPEYLDYLREQARRMLASEPVAVREALLEEHGLRETLQRPRREWAEWILREPTVWTPLSRALLTRWPRTVTINPNAAKVVRARTLQSWLLHLGTLKSQP